VFETSTSAHYRLRELVKQILSNSSGFNASEVGHASSAMRESLVAAIDAAFADVVQARWTSRANSIGHFKVYRDIQAVFVR
jgi:hypothetical protein